MKGQIGGAGGNPKINGTLANYTVANGETVEAGNFVTIISGTIKKVVSKTEKILRNSEKQRNSWKVYKNICVWRWIECKEV